jgi:hypothetical protein
MRGRQPSRADFVLGLSKSERDLTEVAKPQIGWKYILTLKTQQAKILDPDFGITCFTGTQTSGGKRYTRHFRGVLPIPGALVGIIASVFGITP